MWQVQIPSPRPLISLYSSAVASGSQALEPWVTTRSEKNFKRAPKCTQLTRCLQIARVLTKMTQTPPSGSECRQLRLEGVSTTRKRDRAQGLLPRVPHRLIEVFPPAAPPLADRVESIDDLDTIDVLSVLVSNLLKSAARSLITPQLPPH